MYMYNVCICMAELLRVDCIALCTAVNSHFSLPSSRIFVKILFQELAEFMGIKKLNERLRDP